MFLRLNDVFNLIAVEIDFLKRDGLLSVKCRNQTWPAFHLISIWLQRKQTFIEALIETGVPRTYKYKLTGSQSTPVCRC